MNDSQAPVSPKPIVNPPRPLRQDFHGRFAADPELNVLAKRLEDVIWENPLSEDELLMVQRNLTDPEAPRRHVTMLPDFRTWAVRLYLGGAQRTIGYVRKDPATALRFADMAMFYFWKYRIRGAAEPTNMALNFSVERAQRDMDNEPEALYLLQEVEKYLLSIGALKDSVTRQKEIGEKHEQRRLSRTVSGTLEVFYQVHSNRMQQNTNRLEGVERALKRLEDRQAKLIELFEHAIALVGRKIESPCQTYSGVDVTPPPPTLEPGLSPTLPLQTT